MTPQTEPVRVEILRISDSQMAVHCRCSDGAKRWIPRSAIDPTSWVSIATDTKPTEIYVASWLVQKEGLRNGRPRRINPNSPEGRAIAQRYK